MKSKFTKEENEERVHFNRIAQVYEKKYGYNDLFTKYKINKKVGRFVKSVKNIVKTKSPKVLEIGCGTGTYTFVYAKKLKKASILSTDISEAMIRLCKSSRSKPKNVKFAVRSAYETGLKDNSVDVVCGFYILHHINQKKVKQEIARILRPGGIVYFYEPNILNPVVYAIKSNKLIKKTIGDSSEEWAINPTKIEKDWKGFSVVYNRTSEFVWPVTFIPFILKVILDKVTMFLLERIPFVKLIGGSVEICLIKK